MKIFINYRKYKTKEWLVAGLCMLGFLNYNVAYSQKTFLTGQKTGNRYAVGALGNNGGASLSTPPFSEKGTPGAIIIPGFYYGADILNDDNVTTPATLEAVNNISVSIIKVSGANVYTQFRNTGNATINANTTTYFKLKEKPVSTGLAVSVGGLLGLTEFNNIVGQGFSGATNYSTSGVGDENAGTQAGTATTKLIIDKAGEYYAAVTPNANYNSVRLSVGIPNGLVDVATLVSTLRVNVYNAFTESVGGLCSVRPKYSDIGSATGITLNTGALRLLELNDLVANPKNAIDDFPETYSSFSTGVASLGVASSVLQTIFFDHTASADDAVKIHLALNESLVALNLLDGGVTFRAYKGSSTTPVATQTLQSSLNLIGLNVAGLVTVNAGYRDVNTTFKPGVEFDRVEVSLDGGLVSLGVIGDAVRLFDVEISAPAPAISSVPSLGVNNSITVYVNQPIGAITATSAGNNILWYAGDSQTALAPAAGSPANLPVSSIATAGSYIYYAAAQRPGCSNISAKVPVNITVLPLTLATLPNGTLSTPYTFATPIATSTGRTLTYTYTGTGLQGTGLTVDPSTGILSGTPLKLGTFTFDVQITDTTGGGSIDAGTYTFTVTIVTNLAITGGPYPLGRRNSPYSQQLPAGLGARMGVAPYTYVIIPPGSGGARVDAALALPTGLSLSSTGALSGTPTDIGTNTFTVRATDSEGSMVQADFTVQIEEALPVTLVSFSTTKEGQSALLNWSTSAETNSDRFEIERSQNGKSWGMIGTKKSNGESLTLKNYNFSDTDPLDGENLYRLKMVDHDGTFAYSRIASLTFEGLKTSFYPNPVAEKLIISTTDISKVKTVQIFDASGRTVYQSSAPSKEINVQSFTPGLYVIQMTKQDGTVISRKIIKQ